MIGFSPHSKKRGIITLIDCAGSERRNDSLYHDKERQKVSAEINASLYALKSCIRARVEIREVRVDKHKDSAATRIPQRWDTTCIITY